jgi:hypothetical protein
MYMLINAPAHVLERFKALATRRGASAAELGGVIIESFVAGSLARSPAQTGVIGSHASSDECTKGLIADAKLSPCTRGAFVRRRRAGTTGPEPTPHYRRCLGVTLLSIGPNSVGNGSEYAALSNNPLFRIDPDNSFFNQTKGFY